MTTFRSQSYCGRDATIAGRSRSHYYEAVLIITGNAKIDGLQEDLGLTDGQYNATLTIFFVSYALFEPLTNVLLKKMRPSVFLPLIMIWWGICMTCMGLVHNFAGLMTAVRSNFRTWEM